MNTENGMHTHITERVVCVCVYRAREKERGDVTRTTVMCSQTFANRYPQMVFSVSFLNTVQVTPSCFPTCLLSCRLGGDNGTCKSGGNNGTNNVRDCYHLSPDGKAAEPSERLLLHASPFACFSLSHSIQVACRTLLLLPSDRHPIALSNCTCHEAAARRLRRLKWYLRRNGSARR